MTRKDTKEKNFDILHFVADNAGLSLFDAIEKAYYMGVSDREFCEDAVNRQAVLNTLDKMDSVLDENRTVEAYKELLTACYKDLPSVTPTTCIAKVTLCKDDLQELVDEKVEELAQHMERRWIPCSERLPEEMGTYMTTIDYGEHGLVTGQRYYYGRGLKWNDECVIAWMPLPEPYEERQDE